MRAQKWGLAAVAALFVAIRLPLYRLPGLVLGWNSDAALFGLMARAMRDGSDVPVYFWGQFYLGTLTSLWTAAIGDGPLALRIVAALEVGLALVLFWLGLRRTFGPVPAMIATCWLAAGPSFLFHFTIAPIGAEQLFLMAALLFWYATHAELTTPAQWFVIGLISGFAMWLHQGIGFLGAGVAAAVLIERLLRVRRVVLFIIGFLIGYLPAGLSLLRDDPLLYTRVLVSWSVPRVFENLADTVRGDLWLLLADASPVGVAAGVCILAFAVIGFRGEPWTRPKIIAVVGIAVSAGFWILSTYSYIGAVRYVVPIVPLVYGAAARGMLKMKRPVAIAGALFIALALYIPRVQQVNDVAAGRSEQYTNWPGGFDPRPVLAQLRPYRICYGEVWVAHKLEWITSPTVHFVPVRSVHRTLRQSLQLIRQPGPKCYVDNHGNVRALTAAEDAQWAATVVERARKAGLTAPARSTPPSTGSPPTARSD